MLVFVLVLVLEEFLSTCTCTCTCTLCTCDMSGITVTCVKWNGCISQFFHLLAGVRQGGVLSPVLFAIFIDSVVNKVKSTGLGYYFFLCLCQHISLCR